ncbi:MAG: zinc-binding dehydrogenase [bacterium]|nr:zinc-binding dehydrogenase [Gammaproteobacteria bacterium]
MRAAVIYENGPLENIIIEENYPDPVLEAGWLIICVKACSLNYHDVFSRRGMPGIKLPLPLITGSDIAGEVVELGPDCDGAKVGDRVLLDPLLAGVGLIGERFDGGRAEFCRAHVSQLVAIPNGVSFETASCIPLAYATAHRMMRTRAQVTAKDTVLVLGASGGVGTASVLLAKMVGAQVIACASSQSKLDGLADLGADHLINYVESDMRDAVCDVVGKPRITGAGGVDLVVNCTGGGTWIDSTRCMKVGARLVTCGATAGFDEQIDIRYVWTYEHNLMGSNGWRRSDIEAMLAYAQSGELTPVLDRVIPLEQVRDAERLMEDRDVFGKIVITP